MAAARFDFTFTGDKALAAQLAGLTDKLEKRILAQGIAKATKQVLLPAIRASVPVGGRAITSRRISGIKFTGGKRGQALRARRVRGVRLRDSLKTRQLRRKVGRVGSAVYTGTRAQLGIHGHGYYPAHQELSFKTRGTRRLVDRNRQYMKRPLLAQRTAWLNAVANEMRVGLEREVRP